MGAYESAHWKSRQCHRVCGPDYSAGVHDERIHLKHLAASLDKDDRKWHWSSETPDQVATNSIMVHPMQDRLDDSLEESLRSTYGEAFQSALITADTDLDTTRYDTRYLTPSRWYDWVTPNALVGNHVHRFFGDLRVANLDAKVEFAKRQTEAEAHRGWRQKLRQRWRLLAFLAAYLCLITLAFLPVVFRPIANDECASITRDHVSEECRLFPHNCLPNICAVVMLVSSKAAIMDLDYKWWLNQCPCLRAWIAGRLDAGMLMYVEREWHPTAPWLAIVLAVLAGWQGFPIVAAVSIMWACGRILLTAAQSYMEEPYKGRISGFAMILIYSTWLLLTLVWLWGPCLVGLDFVLEQYERLSMDPLHPVFDEAGGFRIEPANEHAVGVGRIFCMELRSQNVVPVADAQFGTAHTALLMLGATLLSLAELFKLRSEDSYYLKGWVDIDEILALDDVFVHCSVLGNLKRWRASAERKLGSFFEVQPSVLAQGLGLMDTTPHDKEAQERLERELADLVAEARKALEIDLQLPSNNQLRIARKMPDDELEQLPADDVARVARRVDEEVCELVLALDLEIVLWPATLLALAFSVWDSIKDANTSPCLREPMHKCTVLLRFLSGWPLVCSDGQNMLGMQVASLLLAHALLAFVSTSRILKVRQKTTYKVLQVLLVLLLFVSVTLWIFHGSGLSGTLQAASHRALPFLPFAQDFVFLVLIVDAPIVLIAVTCARLDTLLDNEYPEVRKLVPGSCSGLLAVVVILGYSIVQGAFDFVTTTTSGGARVPAMDKFRCWVYKGIFLLNIAQMLAFYAGRTRLLRPAGIEIDIFIDRALYPEAACLIDGVGTVVSQAITATAGGDAFWAARTQAEWGRGTSRMRGFVQECREARQLDLEARSIGMT